MINVMKMKLFPFFSKMISIPTNEKDPYTVIFISENSNFINSYLKLNIRRQFVKKITALSSKMPKLISNMALLIPYRKKLGLMPILKSDDSNVFIDTEPFFNSLDSRYSKQSYKRPIVFQKVIDYLNLCKSFSNSKNILMYHVDLNRSVPANVLYRRSIILALIAKAGDGSFPFDNVILAVEKGGQIKFYSIFNKEQHPFGFSRIYSILKGLVPKKQDVEDTDQMSLESLNEAFPSKEKDSILRCIEKFQKKKILMS